MFSLGVVAAQTEHPKSILSTAKYRKDHKVMGVHEHYIGLMVGQSNFLEVYGNLAARESQIWAEIADNSLTPVC